MHCIRCCVYFWPHSELPESSLWVHPATDLVRTCHRTFHLTDPGKSQRQHHLKLLDHNPLPAETHTDPLHTADDTTKCVQAYIDARLNMDRPIMDDSLYSTTHGL